jgi:hypothetical protein
MKTIFEKDANLPESTPAEIGANTMRKPGTAIPEVFSLLGATALPTNYWNQSVPPPGPYPGYYYGHAGRIIFDVCVIILALSVVWKLSGRPGILHVLLFCGLSFLADGVLRILGPIAQNVYLVLLLIFCWVIGNQRKKQRNCAANSRT